MLNIIKQFACSIKSKTDSTKEPEVEAKGNLKKIPEDIQKEMLGFFMQTSIPRKKARNEDLQSFEASQKAKTEIGQ